MTLKTYEWDGSEYIHDPVSQAEMFADALDDCNPAFLRRTFGTVARALGMTEIARIAGVSRDDLYAALRAAEDGDPAPAARLAEAARVRLAPLAAAA